MEGTGAGAGAEPVPLSGNAPPPGGIQEQHQILLNSVLNSTDNAFLALDADRRVIYCNQQYLKLYPFSREFMDSRPTLERLIEMACRMGIYPREEAEELIGRRLRQLENTASVQLIETPRLDGIRIEGFASRLPGGGFLLTFRDITRRKQAEDALRESEARFRSLFETGPAGILMTCPKGNILQANPTFCRFLGYDENELTGRHIANITYFEDREKTVHGLMSVVSGEKLSVSYEKRYVRKDGNIIWCYSTLACVLDEASRPRYCIGMVQDVTDRKRAEEALRESEARFRSIFENAEAGMGVISNRGSILQVNPALCRFFGYSREELLDLDVFALTHEENHRMVNQLFEEVRSGRRHVFNFERRYRRKDGSTVWGQTTIAWLLDEGFRPNYAVVLVQDIDERKKAVAGLQRALRETEAARKEIDAILRSVGNALIVTDEAGRITLMNRAAEDLFRIRTSRVLGESLDSFLQDRVVNAPLAPSLFQGRTRTPVLLELRGDPGHSRFLKAKVASIQARKWKKSGVVVVFSDVTREREIDRMKTDFITTAAHELRTPLTSILGFSQILATRDDLSTTEEQEFIRYIYEKGQVLTGIVSELLDIARIESGQGLTLNRYPCTPLELLSQVEPLMKTAPPGHTFDTRLEGGEILLLVDKGKVSQVLENLLSNAIKYSPNGGLIRILGGPDGESYRFAVSDRGIGMNAEQISRVFDKFYRADASNTAIGGVGLGMSIVKHIVEAHGGRIWVESKSGEGTTVAFTLLQAGKGLKYNPEKGGVLP